MPSRKFTKGQSGNPTGRKKGVPNKVTRDVQAASMSLVEDAKYRAMLLKKLRAGRLHPTMERLLWFYAYGKPKTTIDLGEGTLEVLRVIIDR